MARKHKRSRKTISDIVALWPLTEVNVTFWLSNTTLLFWHNSVCLIFISRRLEPSKEHRLLEKLVWKFYSQETFFGLTEMAETFSKNKFSLYALIANSILHPRNIKWEGFQTSLCHHFCSKNLGIIMNWFSIVNQRISADTTKCILELWRLS